MRRERGQLAIGLALAFTAICAIFGLIFNSAMMAREKMRLQQTTDFAALVGADVQRWNLNHIRDRNKTIEDLYAAALILVALPYAPYMASSECTAFKGTATALSLAGEDFSSATCDKAGHAIDRFYRSQIVDAYNKVRDQLAADSLNVVGKANEKAHQRAMEVFLVDKWLPHGLRRTLAKMMGQNPSPTAIKDAFEAGELGDTLKISDSGSASNVVPLFQAVEESRNFTVFHYFYDTIEILTPAYKCDCIGGFIPEVYSLDSHSSKAKVVRADDSNFTTNFLVSATYNPPNTFVDKTFAYLLKKPDSARGKTGSEILDPDQRPMRIFNVNDKATGEKKATMQTMSLAKPYGGTFPKGGKAVLSVTYNFGEIGDEFKGSKLIGIADHEELEGFKLWEDQDFPLDNGEFLLTEDFLH
jgi:hypothetical protein